MCCDQGASSGRKHTFVVCVLFPSLSLLSLSFPLLRVSFLLYIQSFSLACATLPSSFILRCLLFSFTLRSCIAGKALLACPLLLASLLLLLVCSPHAVSLFGPKMPLLSSVSVVTTPLLYFSSSSSSFFSLRRPVVLHSPCCLLFTLCLSPTPDLPTRSLLLRPPPVSFPLLPLLLSSLLFLRLRVLSRFSGNCHRSAERRGREKKARRLEGRPFSNQNARVARGDEEQPSTTAVDFPRPSTSRGRNSF